MIHQHVISFSLIAVLYEGCFNVYKVLFETLSFQWRIHNDFQQSLSRTESTQSLVLIPIYLKSILILSSHLYLDLSNGPLPVGLPVIILKALLPSSILATWPAHLNLLDLIILTILGERYKLWSSSLWSLLHSPYISWIKTS